MDRDSRVIVPPEMCYNIATNTDKERWKEEKSMKEFCEKIYPDVNKNLNVPGWLKSRTILATTNSEVNTINELMEDKLSGESIKIYSADAIACENPQHPFLFNVDYLNTLSPNGFPNHILKLKHGQPLTLLRNINQREGLCNGTRLIYQGMTQGYRLMKCRVADTGREVLLPRIVLYPAQNMYPFQWSRRQFPVKTAFASTVNKAQGQTFRTVGIWLRKEVFTHGQFYVAASRTGSPAHILFAIQNGPDKPKNSAVNITFREVLILPENEMEEADQDDEWMRGEEAEEIAPTVVTCQICKDTAHTCTRCKAKVCSFCSDPDPDNPDNEMHRVHRYNCT